MFVYINFIFVSHVDASMVLINKNQSTASTAVFSGSPTSGLALKTPSRDKARDFQTELKRLKQIFKNKQKYMSSDAYEFLLADAEAKAKAYEAASAQHETLMNDVESGKSKAGENATLLVQSLSAEEQALSDIIEQLEKIVVENISSDDTGIPSDATHLPQTSITPPHQKSAPASPTQYGKIVPEQIQNYGFMHDQVSDDDEPQN